MLKDLETKTLSNWWLALQTACLLIFCCCLSKASAAGNLPLQAHVADPAAALVFCFGLKVWPLIPPVMSTWLTLVTIASRSSLLMGCSLPSGEAMELAMGSSIEPEGIAVDARGNVYVADHWNNRIQKFTLGWGVHRQVGNIWQWRRGICDPEGMAIDAQRVSCMSADRNIASRSSPRRWRLFLVGKSGSDGSGDRWSSVGFPEALAVDASGNVYVADTNNHRIQKFTSDGVFCQVGNPEARGNGQFIFQGVAVDSSGNVYVADTQPPHPEVHTLMVSLLPNGVVTGGGDGEFADLQVGIAIDASGSVYVADTWNYRIQKFRSDGEFLTQWGSYGSGDGELYIAKGRRYCHRRQRKRLRG